MFQPTKITICNQKGNICPYLDSWYNGGVSCHAKCKKKAWEGIKTFRPGEGCESPSSCPFNNQN